MLRSRVIFPWLRLQIFFRLWLRVKNIAPPRKSRLQKTDLYSKHKKNLNFNIKSFNKPRIFPKNGKPYKNWIYSVSKNVFSFILNCTYSRYRVNILKSFHFSLYKKKKAGTDPKYRLRLQIKFNSAPVTANKPRLRSAPALQHCLLPGFTLFNAAMGIHGSNVFSPLNLHCLW